MAYALTDCLYMEAELDDRKEALMVIIGLKDGRKVMPSISLQHYDQLPLARHEPHETLGSPFGRQ